MIKNILIILLIIALIYLYYQQKKTKPLTFDGSTIEELSSVNQNNQTLVSFLQDHLNSSNLEEIKTKLGEKTLDELLEENIDYETEVDTLTRTKNSLEADLLAQSNAFQSRVKEKEREIKKLKGELESSLSNLDKLRQDLSINKGAIERNVLLSKQIKDLEEKNGELKQQLKKMPGEFPEDKVELEKDFQEKLRKINLLFDEKAKDYERIEFEGLYTLLEKVSREEKPEQTSELETEKIKQLEKENEKLKKEVERLKSGGYGISPYQYSQARQGGRTQSQSLSQQKYFGQGIQPTKKIYQSRKNLEQDDKKKEAESKKDEDNNPN